MGQHQHQHRHQHHDLELGYLGLEIAEPAAVNQFFGEVIGLVPGEPVRGPGATWRNDDRSHRIIVQPGPANDASFLGFEATNEEAFEKAAASLRSAGFATEDGTEADLAQRRAQRLIRTVSPWGVPVEVVLSLSRAPGPYRSDLMPGGFLTEGVGFGHVVFVTTAFDESHRFLLEGLGLVQSDWLEMELGPGIALEVRFYHCNERHHTVALAKAPFDMPQKLHHLMLETNSRDDVGRAFDRVWATDLAIANGLGQHDNDGMFSFYVVSPAGFQVEVGFGGRRIVEPWTDDRRYDRISLWGHQPVKRG
jgi:2,3-dihydroxybiphenyl 1,2-dioxygenase